MVCGGFSLSTCSNFARPSDCRQEKWGVACSKDTFRRDIRSIKLPNNPTTDAGV